MAYKNYFSSIIQIIQEKKLRHCLLPQAIHVKNTWGKHCDKLVFMSSKADPNLGAVALNLSEGRQQLWGKAKQVRVGTWGVRGESEI